MKKTYKYTILTMFLAFVFAVGSMEGMNVILQAKEKHLLAEGGKFETETPVLEGQEQDSLKAEQIEEVVSCWDGSNAIAVSIHHPVSEQISMEEAIKEGREWLSEMGMEGDMKESGEEISSVSAILGTLNQNNSKPYYSFWMLKISNSSMEASLYVNAVTGKVWIADILLYENPLQKMPYWKLEHFIELSGLQPSSAGAVRNQEGTQAVWEIDDSRLCGKMDFSYSQIKFKLAIKEE